MALYILKCITGVIVLGVGILFALSAVLKVQSSDIYYISGATMIAISFIVVGTNIFFMGVSERKKKKELKRNKDLLTKVEDFSSKKRIDSYRNIR